VNLTAEGLFLRRCRLRLLLFLLFHSAKVRISENNTKQIRNFLFLVITRSFLFLDFIKNASKRHFNSYILDYQIIIL
jgi:hypothetical protein